MCVCVDYRPTKPEGFRDVKRTEAAQGGRDTGRERGEGYDMQPCSPAGTEPFPLWLFGACLNQ